MKPSTLALGSTLLCLTTLGLWSAPASGDLGAGDLDPAFGVGGLVAAPTGMVMGNLMSSAEAVVFQSDGKIVVAGVASHAGEVSTVVVRYLDDGTIDPTFGTAGIVNTPNLRVGDPFVNGPNSAAVQSDDKIVVAGTGGALGTESVGLVRYLPDGGLDPTFGSGGMVSTAISPTQPLRGAGVVVQPDGKLVVAGTAEDSSNGPFDTVDVGFAVLRYLSDGTLDATFGSGGIAVVSFAMTPVEGEGTALALQSDGKIVVAGDDNGGIALIRLNANGSLDAGFGTGGKVSGPPLTSVLVEPDGDIAGAYRSSLYRYLPTGVADGTFGNAGVAALSSAFASLGTPVAREPDGSYVVANGLVDGIGTGLNVGVERILSDGTPDPAFGASGLASFPQPPFSAIPAAVAIEPDGKIVAAGIADDPGVLSGFSVARFLVQSERPPVVCAAVGGSRDFLPNAPGPRLFLDKTFTPNGANLSLRGALVLPTGVTFADLDPGSNGARIVVDDAASMARVDVKLPGGAYAGSGTRGWTENGSHTIWTYKDRTGAPLNGVTEITLRDQSRTLAGEVGVSAKGRRGTYPIDTPAGDFPMQAIVVLGGPAASTAGECGQSVFSPTECTLRRGRDVHCQATS